MCGCGCGCECECVCKGGVEGPAGPAIALPLFLDL